MSQPKIEIYCKAYCPYCKRASALLSKKGFEYQEIWIDRETDQKPIMVQRSGGSKTVPQIFINDQHIGGCDDLFELDRQDKLDTMLN